MTYAGEHMNDGIRRMGAHTKYSVPIRGSSHQGQSGDTHIHVPSRSRTVVNVVLTLMRTVAILA